MYELSFLIPKGFRRIGVPFLLVGVWKANIFPFGDVLYVRFKKNILCKIKTRNFCLFQGHVNFLLFSSRNYDFSSNVKGYDPFKKHLVVSYMIKHILSI